MNQHKPKPADLLLHYNYGAAAVKRWVKLFNILADRPNIPRPSGPKQVPMGPARVKHSRDTTIGKREAASSQGGQASGSKRKRIEGPEGAADSEVRDKWDEDEVMLFFWDNSRAARERHARKEQERTEYLEGWRVAVAGNPARDIV